MRSNTSLLGRVLFWIAYGSNFWSSEDRVCSVDNKFSVISVWLILSLGIVKASFHYVFAAPEYLCDIKKRVLQTALEIPRLSSRNGNQWNL